MREILFHQNTSKGTDLNAALRFINHVLRRRAVVFFLSDFIIPKSKDAQESQEDLFFKEISSTRKKHDLVCAQISDPCEQNIPECGLTFLQDLESEEAVLIDCSKKTFREKYAQLTLEFQKRFNQRMRRRGIDTFSFSTNSDYVKSLKEFFRMRENRRNR